MKKRNLDTDTYSERMKSQGWSFAATSQATMGKRPGRDNSLARSEG